MRFIGINRREFLRYGLVGASLTIVGGGNVARAMQYSTLPKSLESMTPVYRVLGRTGLKISIVSFGAMLTSEAEVMRVAFDYGVNYVDTARIYMGGKNEEIVGKAIKGLRDKIYVATKTTSNMKARIISDVEASLKALQTDYVDIIQLHGLSGKDRVFISETREALSRLREQGKVRFFGVTTHTNQADVLNALVDDRDQFFDTALIAYNFKNGKDLKSAIARAASARIGIIAMKTQAGGYATNAMGAVSPHQAALKWVLQNKNITAAIPGMRDMAQLREDLAVMGTPFGCLDDFILKRYGAAVDSYYCRLCGKCEATCPRGVEISTINRCLMYDEAYKNADLARSTYGSIPLSVSASTCLDCSACVARCVNGLDVNAKMKKANQLLA
jgi:uncharacterized protein